MATFVSDAIVVRVGGILGLANRPTETIRGICERSTPAFERVLASYRTTDHSA
jgi:hypothetical protein